MGLGRQFKYANNFNGCGICNKLFFIIDTRILGKVVLKDQIQKILVRAVGVAVSHCSGGSNHKTYLAKFDVSTQKLRDNPLFSLQRPFGAP